MRNNAKRTYERKIIHPRLSELRQELKNKYRLSSLKEADLIIEQVARAKFKSFLTEQSQDDDSRTLLFGGMFK